MATKAVTGGVTHEQVVEASVALWGRHTRHDAGRTINGVLDDEDACVWRWETELRERPESAAARALRGILDG